MIYTKTGEYAIRAILYLSRQHEDRLVMSSEVAEKEDIPAHYLAKILQRMAKYGFVDSFKNYPKKVKSVWLGFDKNDLEWKSRVYV